MAQRIKHITGKFPLAESGNFLLRSCRISKATKSNYLFPFLPRTRSTQWQGYKTKGGKFKSLSRPGWIIVQQQYFLLHIQSHCRRRNDLQSHKEHLVWIQKWVNFISITSILSILKTRRTTFNNFPAEWPLSCKWVHNNMNLNQFRISDRRTEKFQIL